MSVASIRSAGDLEIALLHEAHAALAEIIGPELYSLSGAAQDQEAWFHTESHFNLFLILAVEFFAEGPRSAFIDEKYQNWSLLKGLEWLCAEHQAESQATGLGDGVSTLEGWTAKEVPMRFWCPAVDTHVEFPLRNSQLIAFGANAAKHHLFRLSDVLGRLEALCQAGGQTFSPQELSAVLTSMIEEVRNRLRYHATYLLELLGHVFFALNVLIKSRFATNPTNRVNDMIMPAGVTSDVFKDLYGSVLTFKRYDDQRIRGYTPETSRFVKLKYQCAAGTREV